MQTVLALETSCDESAAALIQQDHGKIHLLASRIASQVAEHAKWGGVVPEIASRRHVEALPYLIGDVFSQTGLKPSDIDAVAATVAPGLAGALMVGSITGRTIAALNSLPFLGIHHLEGHLSSIFLGDRTLEAPYLVLLVSGGHTELIGVNEKKKFERYGRSHDDAAGEAFDKVARLLGLPYPGGPAIENMALKGDPTRFSLPKGRISLPTGGFHPYDFSFSGLKTAMLRKFESFNDAKERIPIEDLSASFEQVVAQVLVERSIRCAIEKGFKNLVMVGGVAANKRLRKLLNEKALEKSIEVYLAPIEFCTDNAAMVGAAALKRLECSSSSSSLELGVSPRWPLEDSEAFFNVEPPF